MRSLNHRSERSPLSMNRRLAKKPDTNRSTAAATQATAMSTFFSVFLFFFSFVPPCGLPFSFIITPLQNDFTAFCGQIPARPCGYAVCLSCRHSCMQKAKKAPRLNLPRKRIYAQKTARLSRSRETAEAQRALPSFRLQGTAKIRYSCFRGIEAK